MANLTIKNFNFRNWKCKICQVPANPNFKTPCMNHLKSAKKFFKRQWKYAPAPFSPIFSFISRLASLREFSCSQGDRRAITMTQIRFDRKPRGNTIPAYSKPISYRCPLAWNRRLRNRCYRCQENSQISTKKTNYEDSIIKKELTSEGFAIFGAFLVLTWFLACFGFVDGPLISDFDSSPTNFIYFFMSSARALIALTSAKKTAFENLIEGKNQISVPFSSKLRSNTSSP